MGYLVISLNRPAGPVLELRRQAETRLREGHTPQAAADAPRFHHQYLPDILQFEGAFPAATVDAMKAAGYTTRQQSNFDEKAPGVWGDSEIIAMDPKTGILTGGDDKRHHFGKAAGY